MTREADPGILTPEELLWAGAYTVLGGCRHVRHNEVTVLGALDAEAAVGGHAALTLGWAGEAALVLDVEEGVVAGGAFQESAAIARYAVIMAS